MLTLEHALVARAKAIYLDPHVLTPLFMTGTPLFVHCVAGLPGGAELAAVAPFGPLIAFIYTHESFDLIAQGQPIPQLDITTQLGPIPSADEADAPPPPIPLNRAQRRALAHAGSQP